MNTGSKLDERGRTNAGIVEELLLIASPKKATFHAGVRHMPAPDEP